MHRFGSALVVLACLALLGSQLSGVHMHVDADGYVGTPVTTHIHGVADHSHDRPVDTAPPDADHSHPGDHDHEGNRDISAFKLGTGASKLLILLTWIVLAVVIDWLTGGSVRPPPIAPVPRTRRERWRPPLRAPPLLSQ